MTEPLHDEEAFDPKNLFNEKKFHTIFVDRNGLSSRQNDTADLIVQLLQPGITRPESEEIFTALRDANAHELLVRALDSSGSEHDKKIIAAACWESGIDFSQHFAFFAQLVCNSGFELAMEAMTVIQEMESLPREEMKRFFAKISADEEPSNAMVNELRDFINSKLQSL